MESSKRMLQWRSFIFVAAAFVGVYFFSFVCKINVLVNFHLFLVTLVLFHSPVSSTNKGCKRCYANSSGKQRSQWFMEDEDHCMLPWLYAARLSWSDCPSEWKEMALFPYPPTPCQPWAYSTALNRNCCSPDILKPPMVLPEIQFYSMKWMNLSRHFTYTVK